LKSHSFFFILALFICLPALPALGDVQDFQADYPFARALRSDQELLTQNTAKLLEMPDGRLVLAGAAWVVPENRSVTSLVDARRVAEIQARQAVLEALEGIQVATFRKFEELVFTDPQGQTVHLERFIHTSRSELEGRISRLPIVGSWWTRDMTRLHVAVGALFEMPSDCSQEYELDVCFMDQPEGDALFLRLIRTSVMLCTYGGVRGFALPDRTRALVMVGTAPVQDDPGAARRMARLGAQQAMLADERGIAVFSVSSLSDVEEVRLTPAGEERMLISDFLELRQERVTGLLHTLPIVAEWRNKGMYYVALGMIDEQ
jgi:hypothetical protein